MEPTTLPLWELVKHGYRWLSNLKRANSMRQRQSVEALRQTVLSARETAVYLRSLRDQCPRDHKTEARLTVLWTELGFRLTDLGLDALAKRCQISGKHWADPDHFDPIMLEKSDIGLDNMERTALQLLAKLDA